MYEHKSENKENEQKIENYEQKNNTEEKNYNQMGNKIGNEEAFKIEDELKVKQDYHQEIRNKDEEKEFEHEEIENKEMLLGHENVRDKINEDKNEQIHDNENYQIKENAQIHENKNENNYQENAQMTDKITRGIKWEKYSNDINLKSKSDYFELTKNDGNIEEENKKKEKELSQKTKKRKQKKNDEYRLEEFLKIILTECFNYILLELRTKIKKCLNIYNKNFLLHMTNCKKYQGNPTKANIKRIFQQTVKNAFCDFDKKCFEGTTRQRSNKHFIDQIYKREDFPSNEEEIKLKQYLEMKIVDLIKKFYDDEPDELINLRENYQNWDEIFFNEKKKKKGFYLLEKYGIIQYAQMSDPLFKNLVDKGRFLIKECNFKDFEEFNGIKLLFVSPNKYPKDRNVNNNPNLLQKKVKDVLMDEKY